MRKIVICVCFLSALFGCEIFKPPFYGLTVDSYGTLSMEKLTNCDPTGDAYLYRENKISDASRHIVSWVPLPENIDETILQENLQDNFLMPGDVGMPNVALLKRSPNEIVFWWSSDLVSFNEIVSSANEFCGRNKRKAIYKGSAKQCQKPIMVPLKINNQQQYLKQTFVISSFQCAMPTTPFTNDSQQRRNQKEGGD